MRPQRPNSAVFHDVHEELHNHHSSAGVVDAETQGTSLLCYWCTVGMKQLVVKYPRRLRQATGGEKYVKEPREGRVFLCIWLEVSTQYSPYFF